MYGYYIDNVYKYLDAECSPFIVFHFLTSLEKKLISHP
jgi:hypothetical protein